MAFFELFPKIEYDFNRKGVKQNMVDLFRSVRPLPTFLDEVAGYRFYEVKNGERPDIVSQRLYGTPDYYWTFFVVNDFLHDGMRAWPMSQEDLFSYLEKEYEGYVITTNPSITRTGDGLVSEFRDSLSGRFELGEQIVGATSGARGTFTKKNVDMNQLVIQNVTGAFIGDATTPQNTTELVVGQTSGDSVSTYQVYKFVDAPYYFYKTDDSEQKPVTNGVYISGGELSYQLSYVTYRTHEYALNEERSKIRYVVPSYIEQFVDAYEELINV
jgi:hypothetical protein